MHRAGWLRTRAVEPALDLIVNRHLLACNPFAIGGNEGEVQAVKMSRAGENIGPSRRWDCIDLAIDEICQRIDPPAGTTAEQRLRPEVKLKLDEGVRGDADQQKVRKEPEQNFRGQRKPGAHELFPVWINEEIASGAHGTDETRGLGIVAEFFSQGGDVNVDGAIEYLVIAVANFLQ